MVYSFQRIILPLELHYCTIKGRELKASSNVRTTISLQPSQTAARYGHKCTQYLFLLFELKENNFTTSHSVSIKFIDAKRTTSIYICNNVITFFISVQFICSIFLFPYFRNKARESSNEQLMRITPLNSLKNQITNYLENNKELC